MNVHFSLDEIRKIIIELGSNKVHRHGVTSICRLEICGEFVSPVKLIFKSHLVQNIFFIRIDKENISYRYKESRPSETVGLFSPGM